MLRLAALPQIAGVKDCCADPAQTFDLLRARPETFSVLTGEDAQLHTALGQGADGGILAAAHVETVRFAEVIRLMRAGDTAAALRIWSDLVDLVRLLFAEPNPAPLKHWLWRQGLIASPELRLPMTEVSAGLAARLDAEMARRNASVVQAA
jgi:4-hydroxy-tetrahydrodipicolinate synthase